ncbi:hypothetical protein F511_06193 [Dorcoceras hygrometricum]|uniref:Uncharacterized protein n=1 Tax=Dorcoceras hygrometricum TaxID=472368 RepID=A0A2Z7D7G4_9LAMI|nr:hypothetical protein F511_06193 [Dorcoceras hygrometricum]
MTRNETPSSACTRRPDEISANGFSSSRLAGTISGEGGGGGGDAKAACLERRGGGQELGLGFSCVVINIGYPRMSASGESSTTMHRILHASGSHPIPPPDDPKLGDGFGSDPTGPGPTDEHSVHPHHRDFIVTPIVDQIGPIESVSKTEYYDLKNHFSEPQDTASRGPTTIVAPESQFRTCPTNHDSIGYSRMSASGESSTTMHRLLYASGSHPIPPPDDPK